MKYQSLRVVSVIDESPKTPRVMVELVTREGSGEDELAFCDFPKWEKRPVHLLNALQVDEEELLRWEAEHPGQFDLKGFLVHKMSTAK